ncbi:unnamed protein product [Effrenium voratum]|nr:unnamed protein product [Effrenium voratum]
MKRSCRRTDYQKGGCGSRSGEAPARPPPAIIYNNLLGDKQGRKRFGEIKSFNASKGYGFISEPQVWDMMKCDVHFHLNEVYDVDPEKVSEKIQVGAKCSFWFSLDRSGRPQARVVRITEAPDRPQPPKASFDIEARQYVGRIKSFKEDTGYGFISCQELFDRFKRDVFLHHKQRKNFEVNDVVKFKIFLDQAKGQPKAMHLEAAEEQELPETQEQQQQSGTETQDAASTAQEETISHGLPTSLDDHSAEEADVWEEGWTRYCTEESAEEFWWCRESTSEWFMEKDPGDWAKFLDPSSAKEYWWHTSGRCFWATT